MRPLAALAAALLTAAAVEAAGGGPASRTEALSIRGVPQTLHLYGTRGGPVAVVTSGDGGWVHLGPDVAGFLASEGYFVVGFDVSEGAGLSVLAATAPDLQPRVAGVVALGLPDRNELGWRFRDSIIYLTKKTPDEPTFSAREVVGRMAPVPLAAIHSTHDEFVALPEIEGILGQAREPKRLWVIEAANHRFSDNQPELQRRLKEAIGWIGRQGRAEP